MQGPNLSSHEGGSNAPNEPAAGSQSRIKVNLSQREEEMSLVKPAFGDDAAAAQHQTAEYVSAHSTPNQAPMSEMNQMEV